MVVRNERGGQRGRDVVCGCRKGHKDPVGLMVTLPTVERGITTGVNSVKCGWNIYFISYKCK